MSSRKISINDAHMLAIKSAGRCNMCGIFLYPMNSQNKRIVLAEFAHIIPYSRHPQAPRAEPNSVTDSSYDNLILLCPNDHTLVDKDCVKYDRDTLLTIKREHENRILNSTRSHLDAATILILLEYCNFQNILSKLQDFNIQRFPLEIFSIGDAYRYFLLENYPLFYPFIDRTLNYLMGKIIIHYENLICYINDYYGYLPMCTNYLYIIEQRPIPEFMKQNILQESEYLKIYVLDFLNYLRNEILI